MKPFLLLPNTQLAPQLRINNDCTNAMIWEDGTVISTQKHKLANLEFICESLPSGRMTDFAVSDTGCVVISYALKLFLDKLGINNIQYFPASVIEREGYTAKIGYFAANIIGLVNCIDLNKSELDMEMEDESQSPIIWSIKKLVLKNNIAHPQPIMRVKYFTRLISCNEAIKTQIETRKFTGLHFVKPERWDDFNSEK